MRVLKVVHACSEFMKRIKEVNLDHLPKLMRTSTDPLVTSTFILRILSVCGKKICK